MTMECPDVLSLPRYIASNIAILYSTFLYIHFMYQYSLITFVPIHKHIDTDMSFYFEIHTHMQAYYCEEQ